MKFEFLGKLRGNDDEDDSSEEQQEAPVNEVQNLSNQGYSQHEITEELRDRGYTYSAINKAMNRAVRESTTSGSPAGRSESQGQSGSDFSQPGQQPQSGGQQQRQSRSSQQGQSGFQQQRQSQQPQPTPQQQQGQGGYGQGQQGGQQRSQQPSYESYDESSYSDEDWAPDVGISQEEEELIETIIEEKIIDIEDEFETIYGRIESLEDTVDQLQEDVHDLKIRKEEDEQEFLQKMEEMEDYLENSQSRIGGLEKAFQQTLPSLVENVRDLTELVEDMREEQ
ncbi:MAG: hypothetical protein SV186_01325 [Candidatus Nanohaloarchaea archaeon]|nr:hypothetical protein [Candidatus Nanohaloarchaea archaeon]